MLESEMTEYEMLNTRLEEGDFRFQADFQLFLFAICSLLAVSTGRK